MPRRRSAAFLLRPVDFVWLAILVIASSALSLFLRVSSAVTAAPSILPQPLAPIVGAAALALASAGIYLTGLRVKDRPTAIISGLLVATSLALAAGAAWSPAAMLMAALISFALFFCAMDWTVAALCFAGVAVLLRADGLMLGVVIAIVALCQRRPYTWAGILAFVLISALATGLWMVPWRPEMSAWISLRAPQPDRLLLFSAVAPVAWFLFPYLAEWGSRQDRAKWWAPALLLACYLITIAVGHLSASQAAYLPLLTIIYLMIGTGIARLLPAFAGELAIPLARYLLAAVAMGALLAATVGLEWTALSHAPGAARSVIDSFGQR